MDAASQYALAYALTTSAGVRAVLALAGVAIAVHFNFFHPPHEFAWLAKPLVMWILIGIGAIEVFADKIPVVDHTLHFVQIAIKPAAAAILVGGSVHAQSNEALIGLMVLGGLNALGIHAAVATLRGASTVTTGGIGNPIVSVVEDTGAIASIFIAIFAPIAAAILAVIFTVLLILLARSAYRRVRPAK